MLVKVIDVLDHPVVERSAAGDVVPDVQMLNILAEAHAASVGTDGDAELFGHEVDGQRLVDAAEAAGVEVAELHPAGLHELLEDNAILAVLARRDADAQRVERLRDGRV